MLTDIDLAASIVTEAAALAAAIRSQGTLATRAKTSVSDVVTDADFAAERLVTEMLENHRPDDGLLGEEGTQLAGTSGRRWIIDPVDGTYNFSYGSDYWCSALALVDGDELILGAIAHHASQNVYVGGPKIPSTCNGEALAPLVDSPVGALGAATYAHPGFLETGPGYDSWVRAASLPATLRMFGSGSMDMVSVATGRIGCWFQRNTPAWDWLPGAALLAGLGAATVQTEVHDVTWSVAGPPTAVNEIVTALQG